jgi:uncharacterized protein (DUF1015 family)
MAPQSRSELGCQSTADSVGSVAEVKPFRALRYDERRAGPLASLVAPPYDVISPDERAEFLARSSYNVVHLTLPDSPEDAGRAFSEWQRDGVLAEDGDATWALSQRYVGPDGVERTRNGIVAALRLEPYDRRVVLPHERTHAGPKEGRLRLLRVTRAELEPIFLLHDGPTVELPARAPDLEVDGTRLWRLDEPLPEYRQLLIADGHHRYETALAFHDEDGSEESAYTLAALVSTREQGLTIFPTHRIAERFEGDLHYQDEDPRALFDEGRGVVVATRAGATLVEGDGVDAEVVERLGPEGVTYTPSVDEALAAVESGRAGAAFLLRPPRLEQVWAVAREGRTMPQKSTYFFPKLLSGLLFFPL